MDQEEREDGHAIAVEGSRARAEAASDLLRPAAPCAPDGVAAVRHTVVRLAHEQGDCPWRRRRNSHSSRCTSCVTV